MLLLSWGVGIKVCHQKSAKAPFLSPIVPALPSLQCSTLGFPTFLAKELDLRRVYTKKKVEELSQAMKLGTWTMLQPVRAIFQTSQIREELRISLLPGRVFFEAVCSICFWPQG